MHETLANHNPSMPESAASRPLNFALIGAAGFVAPRHLEAIHATGNCLVGAVDPHDSVGVLDRWFSGARFFTEIERFDRFLEKLRRGPESEAVDYVSICSPNYLHDAHVRLALRVGAHAICEKPLVINPWNLDALEELEEEFGRRVYTVLQLRLHPAIEQLREGLSESGPKADVVLTYITRRGAWYAHSWKGSVEKSGGVVMNIGIHFFDVLLHLFGDLEQSEVHLYQPEKAAGTLELARARVRWYLSVDGDDLPLHLRKEGQAALRSMAVNDEEIDFSEQFEALHTQLYRKTLAGLGCGIADSRRSIELVHHIRSSEVVAGKTLHPLLGG